MGKLKYINFKKIGLVIFEPHVQHTTMKQMVGDEAISAGFCRMPDKDECGNQAECYGEAVSLKLESRPEDGVLLRHRLDPYG
jgi:hypothetical protein